ncbi:MAG TPA: ABC transporter permease [Rhodoblastus sp.]|nr:ABC transporter permease [Rhodoblastus sp.]
MSETQTGPAGTSDDRGRGAEAPLVPASSIAGRTLIIVVAIMSFLASLAAGGAVLIGQASREWRSTVSREATIQLKPAPNRDMDADIARIVQAARSAPGVAEVRAMTKRESELLLEPWLGKGLNLDEVPVPRMIVLKLQAGASVDFEQLRQRISEISPNANLDDHRVWSERLADMANVLVAIAVVLLALIITAMVLAISFATHGAMAGNREIIEVLHFVGASDQFISKQFQRRFLWLGFRGGVIGAGAASAVFLAAGFLSRRLAATPSGEQLEALFGSFSIGWLGYSAIALIAILSAALSGQTSRMIVFRRLRRLA